mgnify:CR=1 FL=1
MPFSTSHDCGPPPVRSGPQGRQAPSLLRFMNLLKFAAMAAALAGGTHVLHNTTQYPDIPSRWNPVTWFTGKTATRAEVTRTEPARRCKTPRSVGYGFLHVTAGKDTQLTLTDSGGGSPVLKLSIKAGESRDIELRKGYYKAKIIPDGKLRIRLVSFIGSTGRLDL